MKTKKHISVITLAMPFVLSLPAAHAGELPDNAVRVGYAKIRFNLQSGDLTGPPGTTPPTSETAAFAKGRWPTRRAGVGC